MTLPLIMGFAAQLLIGVMSWLLPSTIGGGAALGAGLAEMDRAGAFRWTIINVGLILWLLPFSSWLKVVLSFLVGAAYVTYLPLVVRAAKAQVAVLKSRKAGTIDVTRKVGTPVGTPTADSRRLGMQTTAALAVLALVTTVGVALTGGTGGLGAGGAGGTAQAADVTPTGDTVEVTVTARDMTYEPNVIEANPGDRLVITLVNADEQVHDLRLARPHGRVLEKATIRRPSCPATSTAGATSPVTARWA